MNIEKIKVTLSPFEYEFEASESGIAEEFVKMAIEHASKTTGKPTIEKKYIIESEE